MLCLHETAPLDQIPTLGTMLPVMRALASLAHSGQLSSTVPALARLVSSTSEAMQAVEAKTPPAKPPMFKEFQIYR